MSSTMEHFSHPEHLLILKEDVFIREDDVCYGCNKSVIGSPTYTCTSHDDIDCQNFYLHKSCAELPTQINHHMHDIHPLTLLRRRGCICNVCRHDSKLFTYTCYNCRFDVCVFCAFEQRLLHHQGHKKHSLILMKRESLFHCDACGVKDEDSSYVCTSCEFWIHKTCALSPFIIPDPSYHHHPLHLVYSIPDMHRYFQRNCNICGKIVHKTNWVYYCHKCTYFVHMKCATSSLPMLDEIEADDGIDNEPDLVQFPLPSEESLFDLIITQCAKLHAEVEGENNNSISTILPNDPHRIEAHWTHKQHPLELFQFTISKYDSDDDDIDDRRVLICDGCIQPITLAHPSYYTCIQCAFFLHSFCATKLPHKLSAGASPFHPQHELSLMKKKKFYFFVRCGACGYNANGFFYYCKTCDTAIDIRCALLPTRIKHISHKHHSLVPRPFSNSMCSVSNLKTTNRVGYGCETCSSFKINILCAFYPTRMEHRYDAHPVTLRYPPFFYEGVFYCEICEEQVNNQWWLYHCDECDHSFHEDCLRYYDNVKFGGTIKLNISNRPHTLALVIKKWLGKSSPMYLCSKCTFGSKIAAVLFECEGCGLLLCTKCVHEILGQ